MKKLGTLDFADLPDHAVVQCCVCEHTGPKSTFEDSFFCEDCNDSHTGCPRCHTMLPPMCLLDTTTPELPIG